MQAEPQTAQRSSRVLQAICWLLPGVIAFLFATYALKPEILGDLLGALQSFSTQILPLVLTSLLGVLVLLLLFWPPFWPALRHSWHKFMQRLSFDAKAARDLRARLADFENASDMQALGRLYLESGQAAAAIPILARAIELDPGHKRGAWLLGRAYAEIGQHEAAAAALDAALAQDPDIAFGAALLLRAKTALRLGDAETTMQRAREHEKRNGPNVQNLWLQAEAAAQLGDKEARREALSRLLALPAGKEPALDAMLRAKAKLADRAEHSGEHSGGKA